MRAGTVWALTKQTLRSWRALVAPAPDAVDERLARVRTLYAGFEPAFAQVEAWEAARLHAALDVGERVVLVDVRSDAERRISTLRGAITPAAYLRDLAAHGDAPVVAFCTLGVRAGAWAAEQCADGRRVGNLVGGLLAWTHVEGPLVGPDGAPTQRLHVSARTWNCVGGGYEGVW